MSVGQFISNLTYSCNAHKYDPKRIVSLIINFKVVIVAGCNKGGFGGNIFTNFGNYYYYHYQYYHYYYYDYCFALALCGLLHDVETIFHLRLLLTASGDFLQIYQSFVITSPTNGAGRGIAGQRCRHFTFALSPQWKCLGSVLYA